MTVYEISYDLKKHGQDYDELHDAIRSLGDVHHALESYWLVDATGTSTKEIRDKLKGHIDGNDSLIVTLLCESGGNRWSMWNASDTHAWLQDHI